MKAKKVSAKKTKLIKQVDPAIAKALARRYGTKATDRKGTRYSMPDEIAQRPEAWEGDVSDLEEPELEEQAEEIAKE